LALHLYLPSQIKIMEQKRKIAFIINPVSGTTSKAEMPSMIESIIDKSKYDVCIKFTTCAGNGHELAKGFVAEGYDIVVSVGGDGTMNEIASALTETNTALGLIPCGSGNGLARHLGIPLDHKQAIALFNDCKIIKMDYGKANDVKFFCTCGAGFDAHIGHTFASAGKRGFLTYLRSIFTEFRKYKPKKYKFKTEEGKFKKKAFLVTFANASQYGNNAYIAPNADIQDGLIDVCILEPFPKFRALGIGFKLMSKKIDKCRYVQIMQTDKVRIKTKKNVVFHYDGEPCIMDRKVKISAVQKGLNIAVLSNSPLN